MSMLSTFANTSRQTRFWIPADNALQRERRDRVRHQAWARQGLIEMAPGNVIDYDRIRKRINELGQRFRIRGIAVTRAPVKRKPPLSTVDNAGHQKRVIGFEPTTFTLATCGQ